MSKLELVELKNTTQEEIAMDGFNTIFKCAEDSVNLKW